MKWLLVIFLMFFSSFSFSQCPWNVTDCKGRCGRYYDTNSDGYCDLGLVSIKEIIYKDTVKKAVDTTKTNNSVELLKKETNSSDTLKRSKKQVDLKNKEKNNHSNQEEVSNSDDIENTTNAVVENNNPIVTANPQENNNIGAPGYSLISILLVTLIAYFISMLLVKFDIVRKLYHRKFWNALLLVTFLVSGLLGLFLVVQINYRLQIPFLRQILVLHVEFGIAMAIISIIHIFWHIKYFKNIFKQSKAV